MRVPRHTGTKIKDNKQMKLKRCFDTQKEIEVSISYSEGNLSRFIGMKNINKLASKNIDRILTE